VIIADSKQTDREIPEQPMPKPKEERPLTVRCPNCKQTHEPDFNETTKRYQCPICASPVDAQVFIEKKKRGLK
jgi:ribosomal protein S27E